MTALFALAAAAALVAALLDRRAVEMARRALRWRRGNAREIRAALPALVDAVAAALASGLSLPVALAEVAPTLPPGLAVPTRRAASALVLGATIGDALG
jgi:Flp pilus assembly protein TadB